MRAALCLLLLGASAVLRAGDVYMWVDANGERHWADSPHPGAQKVEITPQNGFQAPPPRTVPASGSERGNAPAYASCAITQPTPDQVYFDVESVTISVQVTPARRPGDVIAASLDGSGIPAASPDASDFTVAPIDRGTHTASAVVRDASGRTVCTAEPVTFHVRQHSIARPR